MYLPYNIYMIECLYCTENHFTPSLNLKEWMVIRTFHLCAKSIGKLPIMENIYTYHKHYWTFCELLNKIIEIENSHCYTKIVSWNKPLLFDQKLPPIPFVFIQKTDFWEHTLPRMFSIFLVFIQKMFSIYTSL